MGIPFSCPFSTHNDLENGFESIIVKSICFGDDEQKTPLRSISFKGLDSELTVMQSIGSGIMMVEGSVSFKTRDPEIMGSIKVPSLEEKNVFITPSVMESKEMDDESVRFEKMKKKIAKFPVFDSSSPKHEAAIKLQKVYKSFRTRRKLADCAVLAEQSWWKLLDFAELKHSSISFFDLEKQETAISRWSRARTRAAKVGKGLSKNNKAQKLALQHWLEAIDPRHRYGHNLHIYYVKWLHSQSKEPFFYWLDIGEGKEVTFGEKCSRSKLQQQCIKYLGPMERKAYEVVMENGKFFYKQTGELIDTTGGPKGAKWIFVLSTSRTLYVGKKKKGTFQHSSFLAGGATSAAGRIVVEKAVLKAVWPHSGHYRPTPENFQDFISFLRENNVDLANVRMDSPDDEEESNGKKSSKHLRTNSSEDDLAVKDGLETEDTDFQESTPEEFKSTENETAAALEPVKSMPSHGFTRKLIDLQIPNKDELLEKLRSDNQAVETSFNNFPLESPLDGYETAEEILAQEQIYGLTKEENSSDEEHEETSEGMIPEESILQRINSHKEQKSYQLGKQLSRKWSTGAGPRIGCLRDYPSELQSHALEQVNLSPRSARRLTSNLSPRSCTSPHSLEKGNLSRRNSRGFRSQSSPSPLCKGAPTISAIDEPSLIH